MVATAHPPDAATTGSISVAFLVDFRPFGRIMPGLRLDIGILPGIYEASAAAAIMTKVGEWDAPSLQHLIILFHWS
jgi:hypothetical protein